MKHLHDLGQISWVGSVLLHPEPTCEFLSRNVSLGSTVGRELCDVGCRFQVIIVDTRNVPRC